jgi:hypothetical protein
VHPVTKELQKRKGAALTDAEIDIVSDAHGKEVILHTDEHGLAHLAEDMKKDTFLKQYFSDEDCDDIKDNGFEGSVHLQELREKLPHTTFERIAQRIAKLASEFDCQGCGHVKTVMGKKETRDPIAVRVEERHITRSLMGSKMHRIIVYKGEHGARAVVELRKKGGITSREDLVPSRVGATGVYFNEPQVVEFEIPELARNVAKKFEEQKWAQDTEGIAQGALVFHQDQTMKTARRLAPGYALFTATFTDEGLEDVVESGKIPA